MAYDNQEDFTQLQLPPLPPEEIPIVPSPNGAVLEDGTFISPNYRKGRSGWKLDANGDLEANDGNFRGDITGASGTFSGSVTVSSINIPDTSTANSFHVDSSGNAWWGATTISGSAASVSAAGAASFTNIIVTGGTISADVTDKTILKAINETVNNSSTFQDDNDFTFPVTASKTYKIDAFISMSCQNASDYKWQWSLPAGATFVGYGGKTDGTVVQRVTETGFFETATSTGQCNIWFTGVLTIAGTGGTATIQWAQQAAAVEDTIWQAGSWLTYKQV